MSGATEIAIRDAPRPFLSRQAARGVGLLRSPAGKGCLALADQAVVSGSNFLTTILVGRACLQSELGLYSLGFTVGVLVLAVQQALICTPYTVYVQRTDGREQAEYAGSVLAHTGMLSGLLALALLLLGALGLGLGSPLAPLLFLLALTVPCLLLREFARRWAFARLSVATALALDVAMSVLQVGGLAGLAAAGRLSALGAHAVVGLACLVVGGAWLALARGDLVVRWGAVRRELGRSWAFGKWLFVAGAVGVVHAYLMHWLLLAALGAAVMGAYAACATLADLANPLIIGVGNVAGPWAARSFVEGGPAGVRRMVGRIALPLGGAMGALCVLAALYGGAAAGWIFHGDYSAHGRTITVLALVALVNALSMAANTGLAAIERPRVSFVASAVGLAVSLVAAACLVAPLQTLGAAYGLLAGTLTGAAVRYTALLRLTRRGADG